MDPLTLALERIGLQILLEVIPVVGEAVVAGIAALVHRFKEANPDHPEPVKAIADAGQLATEIVRSVDALDWGHFLVEDEKRDAKFKTAVADLIGRFSDRGLVLLKNDAEALIKQGVAVVRSKVTEGP